MEETGQPFDVALAVTRRGTSFTTPHRGTGRVRSIFSGAHPNAFLEFTLSGSGSPSTISSRSAGLNPKDRFEPFNMAYLAIRGSGAVNGVSRLHGEVSRRIFAPLFPTMAGDPRSPWARHKTGFHGPQLGFRESG